MLSKNGTPDEEWIYCSRIDYEIINSTKLHPTEQDTTTMAAEEVRVDKWIDRNGNLIV